MSTPKFTLTNTSVTVIHDGKSYTFQEGTPNFATIRQAILEQNWDAIPKCLTVASSIEMWAKGEFTVEGETILYKGHPMPAEMNQRILDMASRGEDPTPVFRFYERLSRNPSYRSVQSLFGFLKNVGIPFDKDGFIIAYKGVRRNLKDCYSGTLDNTPGKVHTYERNRVSDDPNMACHEGLHVGALSYAQNFGDRVVIVKVDPADVVCVPYDSSQQKMRVCKYEVMGFYTGQLPDTTFDDADAPKSKDKGKDKGKMLKGVKGGKSVKVSYKDLDKMDRMKLMSQPLDTLRGYAANHLKMVGASKIPGGKPALIASILEIRSK